MFFTDPCLAYLIMMTVVSIVFSDTLEELQDKFGALGVFYGTCIIIFWPLFILFVFGKIVWQSTILFKRYLEEKFEL